MFGIDDAVIAAVAGPIIGGLLGSGGSQSQQQTQQRIDPRLDDAIYGANGAIPAAQDWYAQNRSGMNNAMQTGMNNQMAQLGASTQGYNQMQNLGMGMMGAGVAGNPFASGYQGGTNFAGFTGGNGGSIAPSRQQYMPAAFSNPSGLAFGDVSASGSDQGSMYMDGMMLPMPTPLLAQSNAGGGWGGGRAGYVPAPRPVPVAPLIDDWRSSLYGQYEGGSGSGNGGMGGGSEGNSASGGSSDSGAGAGGAGNGGGGGGGEGGGGIAGGGFVRPDHIREFTAGGYNRPGIDDGLVNMDVGEYVVRANAAKKIGPGLLDALNDGTATVVRKGSGQRA